LSLLIAAGLHPAPAQILTTAGVLIWNYTLNALWTFKKPQT
jgi:putative flippase GtrA